jgi:hypothetical protein
VINPICSELSFYRLDNAEKILNIDMKLLINLFLDGKCQICICFEKEFKVYSKNIFNRELSSNNEITVLSNIPYPLSYSMDLTRSQWLNIFNKGLVLYEFYNLVSVDNAGFKTPEFVKLKRITDELYIEEHINSSDICDVTMGDYFWANVLSFSFHATLSDLVITTNEISRLLNKESYENLKKRCIALEKKIDDLNYNFKGSEQKKRELALSYWVAGKGVEAVMAMTKPQIHEALKKVDPIFYFSDFNKFWKKQQVIKLEGGKPARNVG